MPSALIFEWWKIKLINYVKIKEINNKILDIF